MKKMFFMLLLMLGIASSAFAQKVESQWNAGVTLGYGTDVSKGFVGVRAMYDIKPAFSLAAGRLGSTTILNGLSTQCRLKWKASTGM